MTAPLVSIVIPCFNAARWIEETIRSALAQTWPRCEIVVIDDGSTDDSLARAQAFASRGVRVVSQPNRGASSARNHGLRLAAGEFIQFLDADDLLAPDKIALQLERAAREPAGTVFTARWGRFTTDPAQSTFADANPLFADLLPGDYLVRYASHDCMMHPAAWLAPRPLIDRAGPWDEQLSLNDDGEFFARLAAASDRIAYCPTAVSFYRSRIVGSLSAQRSRRHLESAHRALTLIAGRMLALDGSPAMRHAVADLAQRFVYDYYPAAPDLVRAAETLSRQMGGSSLRPLGGNSFRLLARLLGWKIARRLQVGASKFPR